MSNFFSGFLDSKFSELLCVCINDSEEEPPPVDQAEGKPDDGTELTEYTGSTSSDSALQGAVEVQPQGDPKEFYEEGLAAQEAGDYIQSISFYKRALELSPKMIEAHANLGEVFLQCKNPVAAEKHYKVIIKLDPFNYKTIYKLGYVYLNDMKKPQKAVNMFERCLEVNPSDNDAKMSIALAYMELGRIDEAVTCFEQLLRTSPRDVDARFNLGNAFLDLGRHSDAVSQYMKVVDLEPKHVDATFNMAVAYQELAKKKSISKETKLRYLSCAMRCYVQISSWKDSISRRFVVDALKGVESVRRQQADLSGTEVGGVGAESSSDQSTAGPESKEENG